MKLSHNNGFTVKDGNPLDTCTCHTASISYGDDQFGNEMIQEFDVACKQCKDVYVGIAIQYVHPDDFHGVGDILADVAEDIEMAAYQTQLTYHGPLLPDAHSIRQTKTREQIQQELGDLPF